MSTAAEPRTSSLTVRKIPFLFDDSINPVWHALRPEWSHMVNGASLTMPYLEPFLVKNVRDVIDSIDDDQLRADARAFVGQEAQHFTNHRRYNEMLKKNGYPELAEIEQSMAADYQRLEARSQQWRLAYTAGFETMTIGLTEWLIKDREVLFANSDSRVASLILWHMVEETEHKNVAFDIYRHFYGDYWPRFKGIFYAAFHVIKFSRRAYIAMLKRDGHWGTLQCRLRLWAMATRFYLNIAPALLRSLAPGHHPGKHTDPPWIEQWTTAFAALTGDELPLLDTQAAGIPARFQSQHCIGHNER